MEDKRRAASEYVRATKSAGYAGLNEETWTKTPPPTELVEYVSHTWDIRAEIPTSEGWEELLRGSGLRNTLVRTTKLNILREFSQIRRYSLQELLWMLHRTASLYIRSSTFRRYMKERQRLPRNLFEYLGYGIYVGRK